MATKRSAADEEDMKLICLLKQKLSSMHQLRTARNQWDPGTLIYLYVVTSGIHGWVASYLQHGNKAKRISCARKHVECKEDVLEVMRLRKLISTDLWSVLQVVWNNLPAEFPQKLCASVPRRFDAGLKARGWSHRVLIQFIFCLLTLHVVV